MSLFNFRFITATLTFIILISQVFCDVFEGVTLITDRLIDEDGIGHVTLINHEEDIVNEWVTDCKAASIAYLQQDSTLIYPCYHENLHRFPEGGRIVKYSWDNTILWDYLIPEELGIPHHDIEVLPNGNILVIIIESRTYQEAIDHGRVDIDVNGSFALDYIIELEPYGASEAYVVWEWHFWDHLVQDINPNLENFSVISDNPQLLNINLDSSDGLNDWNHLNSIHYNKELDQIVISARRQNEFYIIDHSTSLEESASHSGGIYGKGGDFLYRWGNVSNYDKIDYGQFELNSQHSVNWINEDCPNSGNLILFNNKNDTYHLKSAIIELEPVISDDGVYGYDEQFGFLPLTYSWIYEMDSYSNVQSGAFRLPNGNTLYTVTDESKIFEIDTNGNSVWEYEADTARAIKYSMNYLNESQLGDINADDSVDVLDVVMLVSYILSGDTSELDGADINNDGDVNVLDIVALVSIILGN